MIKRLRVLSFFRSFFFQTWAWSWVCPTLNLRRNKVGLPARSCGRGAPCSLSLLLLLCAPLGGQFSVSVFTLDYKGGVCSIEALPPQLAWINLSPLAESVWSGTVDWPQKLCLIWAKGRADKKLATWLWRAVRNALNICYFSLILFSGWVEHVLLWICFLICTF